MIERAVEVEIADQKDAAITIRPRSTAARVELRAFEKLAAERLALAEDAAKRCLRTIELTDSEGVSPFRPDTFEPLLKICGSQLDPDGRYLPDIRPLAPTEPVLPAERNISTVSDRYVLFARRRSANSVLRDIERFKEKLASGEPEQVVLRGAARTLVMGPSDGIGDTYQPLGDTIEVGRADSLTADEPIDPDQADLFFPKAFNDDQVEIIRRLEKADGLVVQGPPGTGKTHTIANIICHMLATGRRVLVVSHGETALRVIRDQLPDGVRDLTISVATSEREGLKQVEKAIDLMLGIVNTVGANPQRQHALIMTLQADILRYRKKLAEIDAKIAAIATTHLSHIPGASETPYEFRAARHGRPTTVRMVLGSTPLSLRRDWHRRGDDHRRFKSANADRPRPRFLGQTLPNPADLPPPATIMEWHRDLVAAGSLSEGVAASEPLLRRAVTNLGPEDAEKLALELKALADSVTALMKDGWAWSLVELQRLGCCDSPAHPTSRACFPRRSDGHRRTARYLCRQASLAT